MRLCPRELCSDCANGVPIERLPGFYACNAVECTLEAPSHCLYYNGPSLPVDVVIITAVQVERNAVLDELHPEGRAAWDYLESASNGSWRTCLYRSSKNCKAGVRLALAKTRMMGLAAAASLTALAIQLFRPSHVVMLGITAGRQGETTIGDVVVPLEVWDYGAGKWEEDGGELLFKPRGEHVSLAEHIRQRCDDLATRKAAFQSIRDDWTARQPDHAAPAPPVVHVTRPTVSGAAVVNAEEIWQRVLKQNDKVLALDMEAYGVALATHCAATSLYSPSWLIAKSVCDYGIRKEKGAQSYAAYTSVRFFKMYLDEFILDRGSRWAAVRQNVFAMD